MAASRTTAQNEINTQLLNTDHTFYFTASDHSSKHGYVWVNGILAIIVSSLMLSMIISEGGDTGDVIFAVLWLFIGLVLVIPSCPCFRSLCDTSERYTISFNAEECVVSIDCGRRRGIHCIPCQDFKQLFFELRREQYRSCICLGPVMVQQRGSYCGGRVYVQYQDGQQEQINGRCCIGEEILKAQLMVQRANTYYKETQFHPMLHAQQKDDFDEHCSQRQAEDTNIDINITPKIC
eukprot:73140_1